MMFGYGDNMGGWGWTLMILGTVAFWGVVILGLVVLVRALRGPAQLSGQPAPRPTPGDVLGERFARGEIDQSEYAGRLAALQGSVR